MEPTNELSLPFLTRKMLSFEGSTSFSIVLKERSRQVSDILITGATKDGPFTFTHITGGSLTAAETTFALTDIPIWICVAAGPSSILPGTVFVDLSLSLNQNKVFKLISGYVSETKPLSWPSSLLEASEPSKGEFIRRAGANPAAGAEVADAVPSHNVWRLIAAELTLVTSATVANRLVNFVVHDGTNELLRIPAPAVQTASTTVTYIFGDNLPFNNNATALVQTGAIPGNMYLPAIFELRTITTNLQAGDNYGITSYFVEDFITELN